MVEQLLLSSGSFAGMRETGGFGQPLHALYPQIRAVLASELGPDAATLLAEPVVDRVNDRIDWYTEGDPDHPPVALSDLPEEQRQPVLAQVHDLLERGRSVAERYAVSKDARRAQLGAMLRVALNTPAETELFLVEGRPVMIRWGFMPDRSWEMLAEPARSPVVPPPASSPVAPRDLAISDVAVPELAAAPAPEPMPAEPLSAASPAVPAPEPMPAEPFSAAPPAVPAPEPMPAEPFSAALPPLLPQPTASQPAPESPPESSPVVVTPAASVEPEPETRWRYVVVGSRYFWSVFALAVLLAVIAAFWWGTGRPALLSASSELSKPLPNADLDRALTQAQQTETELRTRLEDLVAQLAGRRGQCSLPTAGVDAAVPAVREPGHDRAVPARSTVAVAGGEVPREPVVTAPLKGRAAMPTVDAPTADRAAITPDLAPPPADRVAIPAPATPVVPDRPQPLTTIPPSTMPPTTIPPSTSTGSPPDNVNSPLPKPEPRALSETKSPARTLEDALIERSPMAIAPMRPPPRPQAEPPVKTEPPARTEPPVKAEPTPEERREFTNRLSAAGAATGEITATLLWNSPGDLDLVVRCPSGQQLDYRSPAACGGALDVDANATRASLNDRPVENAFWPAGRAGPGTYEVAVRYAPRKDEQNPRETPFQVRLIRGGQESVFKGTVRPNAVTPVTTFTIER